MKQLLKNFVNCGLCGWCLECFWTGIGSIIFQKNRLMPCKTSVWMFPIYGAAAFFSPVFRRMKNVPLIFRGSLYMIMIFICELCTGLLLKKHKLCPWDYSHAKMNYKGVIRLDYAPAWFFTGLLFEKIAHRRV